MAVVSASTWVPTTQLTRMSRVWGSWFWPSPASAVGGFLGSGAADGRSVLFSVALLFKQRNLNNTYILFPFNVHTFCQINLCFLHKFSSISYNIVLLSCIVQHFPPESCTSTLMTHLPSEVFYWKSYRNVK